MKYGLFFLLFFQSTVFAGVFERLQEELSGLESFSSRFTQQVYDEQGNILEESSGMFWLQLPARFQWHYLKPYEQKVISDGSTLYVYDPELLQLTLSNLDTSALFWLELFRHPERLADNYHLEAISSQDGDSMLLEPLDGQGSDAFIIKMSTDITIEQKNLLGQKTIWTLAQQQKNPQLPDSLFDFKPPVGVDVLDQR